MLDGSPLGRRARDRPPVVLRDGRRLAGRCTRGWTRRSPTYAEQLVDGDAPPASGDLQLPGPVDRPTADYGGRRGADYYRVTYDKGAAALQAARDAAGPAECDAAIRCYVNANAWRIVVPSDLAGGAGRAAGRGATSSQRAGALR